MDWSDPAQVRAYKNAKQRRYYRRKAGLPEDVVLRRSPEEQAIYRKARKKASDAARYARMKAENAASAEKAREREEKRQASLLAREAKRLASEAERAEKRRLKLLEAAIQHAEKKRLRELEAIQRKAEKQPCSKKSGNGTMTSSVSNLRANTKPRKPGRIQAMAGWLQW